MRSRFSIYRGDCIEALRAMPDNSVDSVVTDPPYGLSDHKPADVVACLTAWLAGEEYRPNKKGFMGRTWDSWVPGPEVWREVFRVLKPGGHVVAFAGSRTHDLMSMALRLAGFECRDTVMWIYSQGFPKSMNLDRKKGELFCGCEEKAECDVRPVRISNVQKAIAIGAERGEILQQGMQEQGESASGREKLSIPKVRNGEPGMERRGDSPAPARELCSGQVCESTCGSRDHGSQGRVCDGASPGDGEVDRADSAQGRGGAPCGSRPDEQRSLESGAMAGQSKPQAVGAWPVCGGCGLPRIPSGLGTALKPAFEPALLFRKPLSSTVAENVMEHGTGALNIDGCRVPFSNADDEAESKGKNQHADFGSGPMTNQVFGKFTKDRENYDPPGRFPANVIHDGSPEVLALFPDSDGAGPSLPRVKVTGYGGGIGSGESAYLGGERIPFDAGSGSAARFFYCAKTSRKDRNEGLPMGGDPAVGTGASMSEKENANWKARNGNHHPTVKPTDLMRYLCRLVTPPGGVVLDPFTGSGSTGKAAMLEGFGFIGCELSDEYADIAEARIQHALATFIALQPKDPEPPAQADLFAPEEEAA